MQRPWGQAPQPVRQGCRSRTRHCLVWRGRRARTRHRPRGGPRRGLLSGQPPPFAAAGPGFGIPLGRMACGTSYVVLPKLDLYKPIWEYDAKTLAKDFSAHLVFGVTTAAVFRGLAIATRSQ